jgi:hypothetical protein
MADTLFPTPGSVKTLRRYYKDRLTIADTEDLRSELFGESDRAKIILVSTILEDALVYRIMTSLTFKPDEKESDYIFRFDGPLGSFSSRIEIAYIFGLIDKSVAEQLHLIREMRNACAHSKYKLSFAAPELANVAKRLFKPLGFIKLRSSSHEDIQSAFLGEWVIIYQTLLHGSRERAILMMRDNFPDDVSSSPSPDKQP